MDVVTYILCKKYAEKYTSEQLQAISKGMQFKGSVESFENLPLAGNALGDVYLDSSSTKEYVWTSEGDSGAQDDWKEIGKVDLSDFYTKATVDSLLAKKVNSTTYNNTIAELKQTDVIQADLINANKTDIAALKANKQDKITDLAAIRAGAAKGATALQEHQSLDGYATEAWVEGKNYLTEHQSLNNYPTKTTVTKAINAAKDEVKALIPEIPANISAFNNDEGYLKEHQDISNLATKTELAAVENQLSGLGGINQAALDAKQDKLTAGNNIEINNNVISCILPGDLGGTCTIGRDFVTTADIGHLPKGTQIHKTDLLSDLLYNILYQEQYTVSLATSPIGSGNVFGSGTYAKGAEVNISASAVVGYKFDKWSDDVTEPVRTIVVDKNTMFTAIFVEDNSGFKYYFGGTYPEPTSISQLIEDTYYGEPSEFNQTIVCGIPERYEAELAPDYGKQFACFAIPNSHKVTSWKKDGYSLTFNSVEDTENGYTIYYLANANYDADVGGSTYTITVGEK